MIVITRDKHSQLIHIEHITESGDNLVLYGLLEWAKASLYRSIHEQPAVQKLIAKAAFDATKDWHNANMTPLVNRFTKALDDLKKKQK
jgi:hypothetical protein